jgi:hypothetical protein
LLTGVGLEPMGCGLLAQTRCNRLKFFGQSMLF